MSQGLYTRAVRAIAVLHATHCSRLLALASADTDAEFWHAELGFCLASHKSQFAAQPADRQKLHTVQKSAKAWGAE